MRLRRGAIAGAVAVVVFGQAGAAAAAERPWVEIATPRFVVVSNSGEKEARRVAWQFEQVRSVFRTLWPWARTDAGRPFVVFAVRDENTLKQLAPKYWQERGSVRPVGVFVGGPDRDFVALRTDVPEPDDIGVNPYSTAYEGYAYIVLSRSVPGEMPLWFSRGVVEFFGNTVVRSKDVQVGRLIPWHLRTLGERARLPLREVLTADDDSPHVRNSSSRQLFDATAWMLVHYLVFGEERKNLPRFNRYSTLLLKGTEPARAFAEALGEVEPLERGFSLYFSRRLYGYVQMPADVQVDREAFVARALPQPEAAVAQAAFHVAMRRPEDARALLAQARQATPDLAAAFEVEGLLYDRDGNRDEALRAFSRAVELGSKSFHAHHRLAQLLWTPLRDDATSTRIVSILEKAVALNPSSADATRYLADMKAASAPAEALTLARHAVELEPASATHRLTLARVLAESGQKDEALEEARRGRQMGREAEERRRADELIAWITSLSSGGRAAASASTPMPDRGTGDAMDAGRRCQTGDAAACKEYAEAAGQACEQGQPQACTALAFLLESGRGVAVDLARAGSLYDRACAGKVMAACTGRAVLHARQGDLPAARKLLDQACQGGEAQACRMLESLPKN